MRDACEICLRSGVALTRHHLIPRSRHKHRSVKKRFTREECCTRILWVCRSCHNQLHASISEADMASTYYSLDRIVEHPEMADYVSWVRGRRLSGKITVRKKRRG